METLSAYKGNKDLKRSYEQHNYTEEELSEYIKCAQDVVYFASHYVNVVHPDKGLINIELYDYQKHLLDHFQSNRNSIVLSSRQSGKCLLGDTKIMTKECLTLPPVETTLEDLYKNQELLQQAKPQKIGGILLGYLPGSGELEVQTYAGHVVYCTFNEVRKTQLKQDPSYYVSLIGTPVWCYLDDTNACIQLVSNRS